MVEDDSLPPPQSPQRVRGFVWDNAMGNVFVVLSSSCPSHSPSDSALIRRHQPHLAVGKQPNRVIEIHFSGETKLSRLEERSKFTGWEGVRASLGLLRITGSQNSEGWK